MEQTPSNIDLEVLLSEMLSDVASEVPNHLNQGEGVLLSVFLGLTNFESLEDLLKDIECFLHEELDFKSLDRNNVAKINFSALATKFGNRYRLNSVTKISNNKAQEFTELGWKTTRMIFIKVLLPQLRKITFADAQQLVLVIEEFICSYAIIQGESRDFVLDQLKYWDVFKEFEFTLELDIHNSVKTKELPPPDEFIIWAGKKMTFEDVGELLAVKYELIVDKNQWDQFFSNHTQHIMVSPGKKRELVAVLYQMEIKKQVKKSKNKGFWKIWQVILVDTKGQQFSRPLRKTSSQIFNETDQKDKDDYQFGLKVIKEIMKIEQDNSSTKENKL